MKFQVQFDGFKIKELDSSSFLSQDKCHFHIWVYAHIWWSTVTIFGEKYILDDPQVLWKCLQMKFHGPVWWVEKKS